LSRHIVRGVKLRGYTVGLLANKGSLWLGAHYSDYTRRWCINLLPCLTVWVALPGGKCP
jgi:hypothetical protein